MTKNTRDDAYERFKKLTQRLLSVPKKEADDKAKEQEATRTDPSERPEASEKRE